MATNLQRVIQAFQSGQISADQFRNLVNAPGGVDELSQTRIQSILADTPTPPTPTPPTPPTPAPPSDLDSLTQVYNDQLEVLGPNHPTIKELENQILSSGATSEQIRDSIDKTKPKIVSTSGEVYNEATGTYETPPPSKKDTVTIFGVEIGGFLGDTLSDVAEFVDDTVDDALDFVRDNVYDVAAIALTLTSNPIAATALSIAGKVDDGASVGEAVLKTVGTAVVGDIIGDVAETVADTVSNTINVSEDMIQLGTETAISTVVSGGDIKTAIIATAGSTLYNEAYSNITDKLKETIDFPDIKIDSV